MKKLAFSMALVAALVIGVTYVSADTAKKGEKTVIVGTVVEISTYAMKGVGEDTVDAHVNRAELGFPVAILEDETGDMYVCVYRHTAPASPMTLANEVLKPFMGQKVAAQGLVYKAKGANVLRLSIVSEY